MSSNNTVLKFIQTKQIQAGKHKVPTYKIYYEYVKYVIPQLKLSKIEFFRQFNKYFDKKRHGSQRFYLLNNCFDLSPEAMEKAKRHGQTWQGRRRGRKKEENKQKKQMQISGTGAKPKSEK